MYIFFYKISELCDTLTINNRFEGASANNHKGMVFINTTPVALTCLPRSWYVHPTGILSHNERGLAALIQNIQHETLIPAAHPRFRFRLGLHGKKQRFRPWYFHPVLGPPLHSAEYYRVFRVNCVYTFLFELIHIYVYNYSILHIYI